MIGHAIVVISATNSTACRLHTDCCHACLHLIQIRHARLASQPTTYIAVVEIENNTDKMSEVQSFYAKLF